MKLIVRIAIVVFTLIIMVYMTYYPPWIEYHIQNRDPLPYVVEHAWLPTYAWYDNPPPSRGQGWGFEYFQSLLWIQLVVVGWIGAGVAFGAKGVLIYGLMAAGFHCGGYIPRIIIPPPKPHDGWDSPLIFVIMGFTGLIGAGIGLAFSLAILAAWPSRKTKELRRPQRR